MSEYNDDPSYEADYSEEYDDGASELESYELELTLIGRSTDILKLLAAKSSNQVLAPWASSVENHLESAEKQGHLGQLPDSLKSLISTFKVEHLSNDGDCISGRDAFAAISAQNPKILMLGTEANSYSGFTSWYLAGVQINHELAHSFLKSLLPPPVQEIVEDMEVSVVLE